MSHSALDTLKTRLAADPAFAAQFRAAGSLDAALAVARTHGIAIDAEMLQNRPLADGELEGVAGGMTLTSMITQRRFDC